jgi:ribosome-binding protein aMBF1 (putative translation factor)
MSCELCGEGDEWIKTCRTTDGSRLLVCDGCYAENASVLVIARRQGGDGQVQPVLALRQPQGVRGGQPRRAQERLLGDVHCVRG